MNLCLYKGRASSARQILNRQDELLPSIATAMLSLYQWRGNEEVLDVGCGRGLLLAGAAKRWLPSKASEKSPVSISGRTQDMGGNAEAATRHNLELEGVSDRCTLLGVPAQEMTFPDGSFDVIVSNLCLHNIYDRKLRRQAVQQIIRVLKPGGRCHPVGLQAHGRVCRSSFARQG